MFSRYERYAAELAFCKRYRSRLSKVHRYLEKEECEWRAVRLYALDCFEQALLNAEKEWFSYQILEDLIERFDRYSTESADRRMRIDFAVALDTLKDIYDQLYLGWEYESRWSRASKRR